MKHCPKCKTNYLILKASAAGNYWSCPSCGFREPVSYSVKIRDRESLDRWQMEEE